MSADSGERRSGMRRGNAVFLAWRLTISARYRRSARELGRHPRQSVALLAAVSVALALMIAGVRSSGVQATVAAVFARPLIVGLAAALYIILFVVRRRSQLVTADANSWLIGAPIPARDFRRIAALRIAIGSMTHWLVVAVTTLAVGIASDLALEAAIAVRALTVGAVVGGAIGSLWPLRNASLRREASRYVPKRRVSAAGPSLEGLSRWPLAHAIAWHRPENARWLFIVAAVTVPMGASALLGIVILAAWSLASYLIALVRAMPHVAREAALWLRPTVLPYSSFAWALMRSFLLHQSSGAAAFCLALLMMGASTVQIAYIAALWLTSVVMIGAIGVRQGFLCRPSVVRIGLSLALFVIAESRARGWGLAVSTCVTVFHLLGGSRARA